MDVNLTFDLEIHSFTTNTDDTSVVKRIENEAIPRILQLLGSFQARATFFTTAVFAQLSPATIVSIIKEGHEIGCHGYDHNDCYDILSQDEQTEMMYKSRCIIEDISGCPLVSFRAPALRINKDTVTALERNNFRFDSSVSSQRFDGPFTSGAMHKLNWLTAARKPYNMSYHNPFKRGESSIVEVPVSAAIWPLTGTHLRISPIVTFAVQRFLSFEAARTNKPVVFLMHPQEILSFEKGTNLRHTNIFAGKIRHRLKMNNLGNNCLELFSKILENFELLDVNLY